VPSSFVVTGAGRGVGRAVVERLLADGGAVAALELDAGTLAWTTADHPAADRLAAVAGDAADEQACERAAAAAEALGPLAGWVNNAAAFQDASVHTDRPARVIELVGASLNPAVVGSAVAIRHFLGAGTGGAVVNVSSHQAQRPVPGALPYATAKAAIEGLTRALAVEYGRRGIRVNAVALGSIATERYELLLAGQTAEGATGIEAQLAALHPLGRTGRVQEIADAVAYLLSERASFVTGATLPVDGGRAALGLDPEARQPS
jgi:NAD(P)-dependent dehydrogenase (short-subunit alcohol dehydrogenase family)